MFEKATEVFAFELKARQVGWVYARFMDSKKMAAGGKKKTAFLNGHISMANQNYQ